MYGHWGSHISSRKCADYELLEYALMARITSHRLNVTQVRLRKIWVFCFSLQQGGHITSKDVAH